MGDDPGDGCLQEGRTEADDLSIGKQVEQKGSHILKPFRAAEIQEQYADFVVSLHGATLTIPSGRRQEIVFALLISPWTNAYNEGMVTRYPTKINHFPCSSHTLHHAFVCPQIKLDEMSLRPRLVRMGAGTT